MWTEISLVLRVINAGISIPCNSIGKENLPAMQETWVRFLGQEYPLEKEMATHSSILAWRIPMDRGAWQTTVHGVVRVWHDLTTKPPPPMQVSKVSVAAGW